MIALDVPLLAPDGPPDADRNAERAVLLARSVVIDWAARYAEGGGDPARAERLLDAAERSLTNLAFVQVAAARGLAAGAWEPGEIQACAAIGSRSSAGRSRGRAADPAEDHRGRGLVRESASPGVTQSFSWTVKPWAF